MSVAATAPAVHAPQSSAPAPLVTPSLFTPLADFLLLGGGSLVVIVALMLFLPAHLNGPLAVLMLVVANFINHPHFAHSYQIFYRDFAAKAFGGHYSRALTARYIFAGIVAPILMTAFFVACLVFKQPALLGWSLSAMGFFVGWHYTKQGYGILMLQSAITRRFFSDAEKKAFLVNAYATWLLSWVLANKFLGENKLFDVTFKALPMPDPVLWIALAAATLSLGVVIVMMGRRMSAGKALPWTGLMAYGVSIYPWLLLLKGHTAAALVIPAAHSLQYLTVVWRYQLNREKAEAIMDGGDPKLFGRDINVAKDKFRFAHFVTTGMVLGFLGFWGVPFALDSIVPFDRALFGSLVFLPIFWIFINIHHYFLDNVMWRRENADMKTYLFR